MSLEDALAVLAAPLDHSDEDLRAAAARLLAEPPGALSDKALNLARTYQWIGTTRPRNT